MFHKSMRKLLNLSEKISKYLVAAVLIIVPLLPKFPLIKVPGTYVAIRSEDLLMLALAIILVPKFLVDFRKILKDKIIISILIFFGATFISLIAGAFLTQTLELRLGFLHWARRIEYIIPFLAVYLLTPREKIKEYLQFYLKVLVIVVIIVFAYGIGQRYYHFPVIITQNEEYSKGIGLRWTPGAHINSTFAGHYDLSAFMVLVMPILLGLFFSFKNKLLKLILLLSSGMGLWLLINSVSRTAQATYLLAITITLLLLKKIKGWIVVVLISLVCMFMSSGLDARFTQAIKFLYQHISEKGGISYIVPGFVVKAEGKTIILGVDSSPTPISLPTSTKPTAVNIVNDVSISIRYNVEWPRALRAFAKNPLLGTGYSSIGLATDNDYLRMLGETGILGTMAFALIFLRIGKIFAKAYKSKDKFDNWEKGLLFGIFGGVVGSLATALLIDLFEASKFAIMFWMFLGSAVVLIKNRLNET